MKRTEIADILETGYLIPIISSILEEEDLNDDHLRTNLMKHPKEDVYRAWGSRSWAYLVEKLIGPELEPS